MFRGAQDIIAMKMPVSAKGEQKLSNFISRLIAFKSQTQWVTHVQYLKLCYFLRCIFVNFLHKESYKIIHQLCYLFANKNMNKHTNNLFVTSKTETTNSPIHEFKVLQKVFKMKKQGLKCF